jgi:hypothetical protein
VSVTDAPVGCGDAGSVLRLAALQAFNTYVMLATPSYVSGRLTSRTSTSTPYVPPAPFAVHLKVEAVE